MTKNTVLITGCSTGIGKLTAQTFQKKGWNVIATMRSAEKGEDLAALDNVQVMPLDVSDLSSVDACFRDVSSAYGRLDVVVNNAGQGGHALLEVTGDDFIHNMFETNVFGTMRVCRAAVPVMRKQKSGCLINVTSMAGYMGLPVETSYCASKFAIEGFTEALYWELRPLNIKVKSVAPGAYMQTNFSENAHDDLLATGGDKLAAYTKKFRDHFMGAVRREGGETANPQEVADQIYKCATEDTPVSNPTGKDAQMIQGLIGASRADFLSKVEPLLLPK